MPPLVMVAMGVLQIALGLFAYYVRIARNFFVGYRTARSMASEEAWLYANRTFGKLCGMAGAFDLLVGIGGLAADNPPKHALLYGINLLVFILGLMISIYLTERRLARKQDRR